DLDSLTSCVSGRQSIIRRVQDSGSRDRKSLSMSNAARLFDVVVELLNECIHGVEWPNVSQTSEKVNLQRLAIQNFVMVNQMHFDAWIQVAEGRAGAEINSGRPTCFAGPGSTGIDALGRQQRIDAGQVRGGKANFRAAARAMGHDAADAIRSGQHL